MHPMLLVNFPRYLSSGSQTLDYLLRDQGDLLWWKDVPENVPRFCLCNISLFVLTAVAERRLATLESMMTAINN